MSDPFSSHSAGLAAPASRLFEITPDDAADLATFTRAISVATAGNVRVTTVGGDTGDIYLVPGVPFPIRVTRVWATGTDATGIRGLV